MNFSILTMVVLVLAAIPCGLFLANLLVYRRTPKRRQTRPTPLSVLIPARNEEANIRATLQAVLANADAEFEVIVLNDHSTDCTAAIVSALAAQDNRLRLAQAPPLPPGWCGKQHACHVLAGLARNPLLVFIDADVRLEKDALARLATFMAGSRADLASGVPRQELVTLSEQLLIPLIHFILLGFLPMHAMRRSRLPYSQQAVASSLSPGARLTTPAGVMPKFEILFTTESSCRGFFGRRVSLRIYSMPPIWRCAGCIALTLRFGAAWERMRSKALRRRTRCSPDIAVAWRPGDAFRPAGVSGKFFNVQHSLINLTCLCSFLTSPDRGDAFSTTTRVRLAASVGHHRAARHSMGCADPGVAGPPGRLERPLLPHLQTSDTLPLNSHP